MFMVFRNFSVLAVKVKRYATIIYWRHWVDQDFVWISRIGRNEGQGLFLRRGLSVCETSCRTETNKETGEWRDGEAWWQSSKTKEIGFYSRRLFFKILFSFFRPDRGLHFFSFYHVFETVCLVDQDPSKQKDHPSLDGGGWREISSKVQRWRYRVLPLSPSNQEWTSKV